MTEQGIKEFLDWLSNITVYIKIIALLIPIVFAFFAGRYIRFFKWLKLRMILGIKKDQSIEIIPPTFEGNLQFSDKEAQEYRRLFNRNIWKNKYITFDESETLINIQRVLTVCEYDNEVLLKSDREKVYQARSNKIIIGGPLGNYYTMDMFLRRRSSVYSFNGRFIFVLDKKELSPSCRLDADEITEQLSPEASQTHKYEFRYEKKNGGQGHIIIPNRYIILIKLNSKDLETTRIGPLLICFGDTSKMTSLATKYLYEYADEFFKYIKNKKHFFIIFKCTENGEIVFHQDSIIDLTDEML